MAVARKDTAIGFEIKPAEKNLTKEMIDGFEACMDHFTAGIVPPRGRSAHDNPELAKQTGLAAPVASASIAVSFLNEILTEFFGDGWKHGGKLDVRFISPAYAGYTITAHGTVKEAVPEGPSEGRTVRLVLDVWCEDQDGRRTAVGTASGLVR